MVQDEWNSVVFALAAFGGFSYLLGWVTCLVFNAVWNKYQIRKSIGE